MISNNTVDTMSSRSTGGVRRRYRILAEIGGALLIAVMTIYLMNMRISHRLFPEGDEGSWMSVAAQLSRGEGFTTRWYEHPFQKFPMLPRPEDFRYPGLSLVLALSFKVFGISYTAALMTTCLLFLLFLLLFYLIIRKIHGFTVALLSTSVAAFSLLQLRWNCMVYSEGMFEVGLCLLVAAALFLNRNKTSTWIVIGLACGLLYYIRPNGLAFAAGFLFCLFKQGRIDKGAVRPILTGMAILIASISPWMLRNWVVFGNPLHITGGAGVLRASPTEPFTWTVFDFMGHYGSLVYLKSTLTGSGAFFRDIPFFEKNLYILPGIGIVLALIRHRPFYNRFIATGFILSFLACFYVSATSSWAGIRYASPFLPFLYAYGIAHLVRLCRQLTCNRQPVFRVSAIGLLALLLLSPLYYPHRYYMRSYKNALTRTPSFTEHRHMLDSLVNKNDYYLADAYGQLAFLSTRRCGGIQMYVDSTLIPEYMRRYAPVLMVLSNNELTDRRIQSIVREIGRCGFEVGKERRCGEGWYYRIGEKDSSLTQSRSVNR